MFGQILQSIVTIAVTLIATSLLAPLGPFAPVVGAMAGNAAGQGFGLATGIQTGGFSWKAVAESGISALFAPPGTGSFVGDVVAGAVSNVVTQGVEIAVGLEHKFDWAGVAVAGLSNGVSRGLSGAFHAPESFGADVGQRLVRGAASLVIAAGTRSLIEGTDFGDNIRAALPSVIAQSAVDFASDIASGNTDYAANRAAGEARRAHAHGDSGGFSSEAHQQPAAGSAAQGAPVAGMSGGALPDWVMQPMSGRSPLDVAMKRAGSNQGAGLVSGEGQATSYGSTENPMVTLGKSIATDGFPSVLPDVARPFPNYLNDMLDKIRAAGDDGGVVRAQIAKHLVANYMLYDAIENGNGITGDDVINGVALFSKRSMNFSDDAYTSKLDPQFHEWQYNSSTKPLIAELAKDPTYGSLFAAAYDLNEQTYAAYRQTSNYKEVQGQQAQADRYGMAGLGIMAIPLFLETAATAATAELGWGTRVAAGASAVGGADYIASAISSPLTQNDQSLLARGIDALVPGGHGNAVVLGLNLALPGKMLVSGGFSKLKSIGAFFMREAPQAASEGPDIVVTATRAAKEVPHVKPNYSVIADPPNLTGSTKPTPRMVREMKRLNMEANGGVLRDDRTGEIMVPSVKSQRGVTPRSNEVQVDHIIAVDNGGTRTMTNLELRTRVNNRAKWNK